MGSSAPSFWTAFNDAIKQNVRSVQDYTLLSARAVAGIFVPPHYVKDLLEQMDIVGVGSLPIVLLTGFFIGGVLVLSAIAVLLTRKVRGASAGAH